MVPAMVRPYRPTSPTACWWCGWPEPPLVLGGGGLVAVCDASCAEELEAFVEAEELEGKGAAPPPYQGDKAAPPDNPASVD
jgi:hypothetical protein